MFSIEGKYTWKKPHLNWNQTEQRLGEWQLMVRHRAGVVTKERGTLKRGKLVSEKNFTNLSTVRADALGAVGRLEGSLC